jgi:predicted RND superfamily exporter protein
MSISSNSFLMLLEKYRRLILAVIVLITIFFIYAIKDLRFDTNWRIWYTKETLAKYDSFVERFGYDDAVVIGIYDEKGILNPKALRTIRRITEELDSIRYIAGTESLSNYRYVTSKNDNLMSRLLLETLNESNKQKLLESIRNDKKFKQLISHDEKSTLIIAHIDDEVTTLSQDVSGEIMHQVYNIIENEKYSTAKFFIMGGPETTIEFERLATRDVLVFTPLIFLAMGVILYYLLGHIQKVVVALSIILLTIIWAWGIEVLLGRNMNNFTANIPLFIMSVALADTLHMFIAHAKVYAASKERIFSVNEMLKKNLKPLFLTSVTTAVGFGSLIFSPIEPVRLLGEAIGVAILLAFLLSVLLVSIFLLHANERVLESKGMVFDFSRLKRFIGNNSKKILTVFLVVFLFLILGAAKVRIDSNLIEYFDEDVSLRKSIAFISKNITGPLTYEIVLDTQKQAGVKQPEFLKTLENFEKDIKSHFSHIREVVSIVDIVKKTNKVLHNNENTFYTLPKSKYEVAQYIMAYEMLMPSSEKPIRKFMDADERFAHVTLYVDVVGTKEDLRTLEWIKKWWSDTSYNVQINGSYALFAQMQSAVSKTLLFSFGTTLIFLLVVLWLAFRAFKLLWLYMLPNLLPLAAIFGLMGWMNIGIDLGMAVSFAIALSVTIDDTLHFITKYDDARSKNLSKQKAIEYAYDYAGTGIIFTTIVIIFSLGLLVFSDFTPNKHFGLITSVSLIVALLVDLIMLPALLLIRKD